jgi:hypothetical protein
MSFTERLQQEFIERIQRVLAELADKVEFDLGLRSGIHQLAAYPRTRGFSHADVVRAATARYYKQLGNQTRLLAFMDCFHIIAAITLLAAPLVWLQGTLEWPGRLQRAIDFRSDARRDGRTL